MMDWAEEGGLSSAWRLIGRLEQDSWGQRAGPWATHPFQTLFSWAPHSLLSSYIYYKVWLMPHTPCTHTGTKARFMAQEVIYPGEGSVCA